MRLTYPLCCLSALLLCSVTAGCGSGNSSPGSDQTLQFGALTTRVRGDATQVVVDGSPYVSVTGLAGGDISLMSLEDTSPYIGETRIAFSSRRDGNYEIYSMLPDGTLQTRLTAEGGVDADPCWSPDRTRIAFASNRVGNYNIYVMNADGTGQVRLTNNVGVDADPAWSPDGTKIAFTSERGGNMDIYVMNVDGTSQTRVTTAIGSDSNPDWSPDGAKIAFVSDRVGNPNIYVMGADGSNQIRLTDFLSEEGDPAWSPDGQSIAFMSRKDGFDSDIYRMPAAGGIVTPLTASQDSVYDDYAPSWSPDGVNIVHAHSYLGGPANIRVISAVNGAAMITLTSSEEDDTVPDWSAFVKRHIIVGPGGKAGSNAAGFMLAQRDMELRSLVVFDATSRNTARVDMLPQGGGYSNVIFGVSAVSITRLSCVDFTAASLKIDAIIGPGTAVPSATNAIVSIGATTGKVNSVLPYTAVRGAAPAVTVESGAQVLRGKFTAVFDGKGVNRAQNGAAEVRFDASTGEIASIR